LLLSALGAVLRPATKGTPVLAASSPPAIAALPLNLQPAKKAARPECLVRKANGQLDERECDLIELCRDRVFYTKRLAKYQLENNQQSAMEAQGSLNKNERWLADYARADVEQICSENYAPYQKSQPSTDREPTEKVASNTSECSRSPIDVFTIGERFQNGRLSALTDKWCPQAKWLPDQTIEALYSGKTYVVQTKKLPFDGTATYEIVSIKAK